MTNNCLTEICTQLKGAGRTAIFLHTRPDGDAIGSGLALCEALKSMGKQAIVVCDDVPPQKYSFLSGVGEIRNSLNGFSCDTLIAVDCADVTRIGRFYDEFVVFKGKTINIDHHISNKSYATYNYVAECPATSEILYDIISACNVKITKLIADYLMLGLVTDSGNFTHSDVSEKTFAVAAKLRAAGADVTKINYNVFCRQPKERALLYVAALSSMRFALDNRLAIIVISLDSIIKTGADSSLTEGFVDYPLTIDGVEVAIAMLEVKKNKYKISLRSKGKVNVNAVAAKFGGGGHVLASGCMLFGELEEVIEKLTYAVYQNI